MLSIIKAETEQMVAKKQMETNLFTKEINQKIQIIYDEIAIGKKKANATAKACKFYLQKFYQFRKMLLLKKSKSINRNYEKTT